MLKVFVCVCVVNLDYVTLRLLASFLVCYDMIVSLKSVRLAGAGRAQATSGDWSKAGAAVVNR